MPTRSSSKPSTLSWSSPPSNWEVCASGSRPGQDARHQSARPGVVRRRRNCQLITRQPSIQAHSSRLSTGTPPASLRRVIRPCTSPLSRLCRYYLDCLGHDYRCRVSLLAAADVRDARYTERESLPPYTKGLESELRSLQSLDEREYHWTALGRCVNRRIIESPPPA